MLLRGRGQNLVGITQKRFYKRINIYLNGDKNEYKRIK